MFTTTSFNSKDSYKIIFLNTQLNKVFKKLFHYKDLITFAFLKYLEFTISAFLFFGIAKISSPSEYGDAVSDFLMITYSSFIVIGINQVLVKWHSMSESSLFKSFILNYNIIFNVFFSIILFFLILFFFKSNSYISISLICSLKLISEGFVSVFRVRNKIFYINAVYLSSSLTFLFLFFYNVDSIESFFQSWSYSIMVGLTTGLILYLKITEFNNFITLTKIKLFKIYKYFFLKEGIKLTLITILGTLIISIDRLFYLNVYDFSDDILGSIQLADNISTVVSLGIGSILFIITPKIIENLSSGSLNKLYFYKRGYMFLLIFLIFALIINIPILYFTKFYFTEYNQITFPLYVYTIIKILNLGFFMPNLISNIMLKEKDFLKITFFWLSIVIFVFIMIYPIDNNLKFYLCPIFLVLILVAAHIHLTRYFYLEN